MYTGLEKTIWPSGPGIRTDLVAFLFESGAFLPTRGPVTLMSSTYHQVP